MLGWKLLFPNPIFVFFWQVYGGFGGPETATASKVFVIPVCQIIGEIHALAGVMRACFNGNIGTTTTERMVKWHSLRDRGVILNVDGSCFGNPGRAGFGGLLRDDDGTWIAGFLGYIGISTNVHAELLAILFGLNFTWDRGIRSIICYSDSQLAIDLITGPIHHFHKYASVILESGHQRAITTTLEGGCTPHCQRRQLLR